MDKYILALDQGTTSSRAIVFDTNGNAVSSAQYPVSQYYPQPGWVEQDPEEILSTLVKAASEAVKTADVKITCIGITNQRETVVVWDKSTGKPVYNAVVWQCRRTAEYCEWLVEHGHEEYIKKTTGLYVDAYFSGTKLKWIFDNIKGTLQKAKDKELLCGTIDTWIIWNLTGGRHVTDITNASRTMLLDINRLEWDKKICDILNIPLDILPGLVDTAGIIGHIDESAGLPESLAGVPVSSAVGDQQAALFGQACFEPGDVKNTYGTGCFTLMNIGNKPVFADDNLITTVAWKIRENITYALEGSVFNAGSSVQWLRDELGIIKEAPECDSLAESVDDSGGLVFVSAFTGLGAPHWDMYARGMLIGLTRGTRKEHICRAVLEGIGYQVCDLITAMEESSGRKINVLKTDGGSSVSDFLMQFQADMLGIAVDRPVIIETTALGAAFLAGIGCGIWESKDEITAGRRTEKLFAPTINDDTRKHYMSVWHDAVSRSMNWERP